VPAATGVNAESGGKIPNRLFPGASAHLKPQIAGDQKGSNSPQGEQHVASDRRVHQRTGVLAQQTAWAEGLRNGDPRRDGANRGQEATDPLRVSQVAASDS
jgi:hypothetical protein